MTNPRLVWSQTFAIQSSLRRTMGMHEIYLPSEACRMANFQATLAKQVSPGPTGNVRLLLSSTVPSTLCCSKITRWPGDVELPLMDKKRSPSLSIGNRGDKKGRVHQSYVPLQCPTLYYCHYQAKAPGIARNGKCDKYPKCNTKGFDKVSKIQG